MRWINLCLLVAFPLVWFAPLARMGLTPWFGLSDISVISGLQALWSADPVLALVVTFLAIFAPWAKTIGIALLDFGLLSPKALPALQWLGRLAMADVFLVALYIVLVKGMGLGHIETAWGLHAFTALILLSLWLSHRARLGRRPA